MPTQNVHKKKTCFTIPYQFACMKVCFGTPIHSPHVLSIWVWIVEYSTNKHSRVLKKHEFGNQIQSGLILHSTWFYGVTSYVSHGLFYTLTQHQPKKKKKNHNKRWGELNPKPKTTKALLNKKVNYMVFWYRLQHNMKSSGKRVGFEFRIACWQTPLK